MTSHLHIDDLGQADVHAGPYFKGYRRPLDVWTYFYLLRVVVQAAEMFPKVKVNRRTVSINVHTFTKKFKVATDQSVMEVAALANKYVLAGNEMWAVLNTMTKRFG